MSEVIAQVSQISELRDAGESNEATTVELRAASGLTEILELRLADGTAYAVDKVDPKFEIWKQFLDWQHKWDLPVYIAAETPSRLVRALLPVFTLNVKVVDPLPVVGRLRVIFQASPAIYFLNPALPRFREMRHSLEEASTAGAAVMVTHHPLTFEILDVRDEPPTPPVLPNGPVNVADVPALVPASEFTLPVSEITIERAFAEFDLLAAASGIPFDYVWDCCTARAQKMCRLLQERNIVARKIWNYGRGYQLNQGTLSVKSSRDPSGRVFWRFHVAPLVNVVGGQEAVVFDPALFKRPVTLSTWLLAQNDDKATQEISAANVYENNPGTPLDLFDPGIEAVDEKLRKEGGESIILELHKLELENRTWTP